MRGFSYFCVFLALLLLLMPINAVCEDDFLKFYPEDSNGTNPVCDYLVEQGYVVRILTQSPPSNYDSPCTCLARSRYSSLGFELEDVRYTVYGDHTVEETTLLFLDLINRFEWSSLSYTDDTVEVGSEYLNTLSYGFSSSADSLIPCDSQPNFTTALLAHLTKIN